MLVARESKLRIVDSGATRFWDYSVSPGQISGGCGSFGDGPLVAKGIDIYMSLLRYCNVMKPRMYLM